MNLDIPERILKLMHKWMGSVHPTVENVEHFYFIQMQALRHGYAIAIEDKTPVAQPNYTKTDETIQNCIIEESKVKSIYEMFLEKWDFQQGSLMLKDINEGKEWKKTVGEFFFQEGHASRNDEVELANETISANGSLINQQDRELAKAKRLIERQYNIIKEQKEELAKARAVIEFYAADDFPYKGNKAREYLEGVK